MQQTEIYQFNKIDMDDTFSPDPINENTEKLEAALADMKDSLGGRLATLEGHKLVTGTYKGTYGIYSDGSGSQDRTIYLGFTPTLVLITNRRFSSPPGMALPDSPVNNNSREVIKIVSGGFYVSDEFNNLAYYYNYLALL